MNYVPITALYGGGYVKDIGLCVTPIINYSDCGIWVMLYRSISITSPYELFMWKLFFLCDGEIQAVHSYHQAVDTSTESNVPTRFSNWQAWLAVLVQMSGYVMIFSIIYSIFSFVKVRSSKIQRSWLTIMISSQSVLTHSTRSWSRSVLNHFTSALETSENIELCLHPEGNRRIQVCTFHYYGVIGTA